MRRSYLSLRIPLLISLVGLAVGVEETSGNVVSPNEPEAIQIPVGALLFDALAAGPVDGEPVILLHGFPQTSFAFRHQLRALAAAGYRAVAPDQRGYSPGARPPVVAAYRMSELVGDVLGIAGALELESFHLVGHDWGGAVAWVVAGVAPERVRSLTVLSTPHVNAFGRALASDGDQAERSSYFDELGASGAAERLLADGARRLRDLLSGLETSAVDRYVGALGSPEALRGALNWYRASGPGAPSSGSPSQALLIEVPTLYVWGTADAAFGRRAAEATAEFVDGPYRFEVLDGQGHWLMEQAAERVSRLLLDQLCRQREAPR